MKEGYHLYKKYNIKFPNRMVVIWETSYYENKYDFLSQEANTDAQLNYLSADMCRISSVLLILSFYSIMCIA